ncbi:hypothetical protein ANO14919_068230 [Xylariales sp. No.14919]|nr:hypothetical protein ANO14919_068230 [Xylariales sp. No.14919]
MSSPEFKGLAASRWASDVTSDVTSWPRPPPAQFNPTVGSAGTGQLGPSSSSSSSPPLRRLANISSRAASYNDQAQLPQDQQLSRFLKIVARLKWKLPFLEGGYGIAINRVGKVQQKIESDEIHFKLDFHEYYMLIERALVHLMGVYDIVIYAQRDPSGRGYGIRDANKNEPDVFRDRSQPHQYHENVLLALGDPANPLHETLGQPGVRKQFARAKELRNRWKNADEAGSGRFTPAPLETYNLREILQTILQALEQAFYVTDQFVRRQNPGVDEDEPMSTADWTTDSADWGFMVDAMDWEVV